MAPANLIPVPPSNDLCQRFSGTVLTIAVRNSPHFALSPILRRTLGCVACSTHIESLFTVRAFVIYETTAIVTGLMNALVCQVFVPVFAFKDASPVTFGSGCFTRLALLFRSSFLTISMCSLVNREQIHSE